MGKNKGTLLVTIPLMLLIRKDVGWSGDIGGSRSGEHQGKRSHASGLETSPQASCTSLSPGLVYDGVLTRSEGSNKKGTTRKIMRVAGTTRSKGQGVGGVREII